jgi:O-antigen/teichoic acid export membrane protein
LSQVPSLRRNTVWTTIGQLAGVALQAVYFVMIGRTLGSYEYGLFVGIYSLVAVLSPYSSLGFGMIMLRDASRDGEQLARAWGRSLTVLIAGSAAVILLAVISSHFLFHRNILLALICIAFSDAFCARAIELAGQAFQARHLLSWTARLNTLMGVARTVAALCLALYGWHTHMRASVLTCSVIYAAFSFAAALAALLIVHVKLVKPTMSRISRRDIGEGMSFALSSSSFSIYNDIDKTMLASYGFIQAAGTYSAAYRVIEVATAPVRAVYAAAMPRIFQYGAEGSGKVLAFSRQLLKLTGIYAALACGLLIWSAPAATSLLGKSFAGSVPAIRILAFLPLLRCLHYSAGNALTGCTSQWYRTSAQLFAAVLNLVLNLMLLPHWSWKGAAVASLITDGTLGAMNWATLLYLHSRRSDITTRAPLAVTAQV